jgi:hypothetical protein
VLLTNFLWLCAACVSVFVEVRNAFRAAPGSLAQQTCFYKEVDRHQKEPSVHDDDLSEQHDRFVPALKLGSKLCCKWVVCHVMTRQTGLPPRRQQSLLGNQHLTQHAAAGAICA